MSKIELGKRIDFILKDYNDNDVSLSNFKGKKVLLSFHPFAWTPVCTDQMRRLERNYDNFLKRNIVPIGVSIDTPPSKKVWASALNIEKVKLLSDFNPFASTSKNFDIFLEELNSSGRANFLLDEDGKLIYKKIYDIPELPCMKNLFKDIDNIL